MKAAMTDCDDVLELQAQISQLNKLSNVQVAAFETLEGKIECSSEASTQAPTTTKDDGAKDGGDGDDGEEESFMEENGMYILIICLAIMIIMICGMAFLCSQKNDKITREVVYVNNQSA